MAKAVMVMGTSSNVGKSIVCTGLCRIFRQDGHSVAPFKSQNMSLNSAVTPSGREIGRAQAAQAEACGIPANEHMNPVLLKPSGHHQSQVVLQGQVYGTQSAREYFQSHREDIWEAVVDSYNYLSARHDLIVIEGAGSPVEMNLKPREIANMRTAQMSEASVILVADIDRGGVFASIVGTLQLLTPEERQRVKGIIVNKFRGDPALFEDGIRMLESYSNVPVLGVLPYLESIDIDEEDSVAFEGERYTIKHTTEQAVHVAIVHLPHLSNFTDFDPLFIDPFVQASFCKTPSEAQSAHVIVIPGTKNTMEDLQWLHETGWSDFICEHDKNGGFIFGICGGYQMLGMRVADPTGQESHKQHMRGLELVPIQTTLLEHKYTKLVQGKTSSSTVFEGTPLKVEGYEIHMGTTEYLASIPPFAYVCADDESADREDGIVYKNGKIIGTYLHGIFDNEEFRTQWLNHIRKYDGLPPVLHRTEVDTASRKQVAYDRLADHMRQHLNLDAIYRWLE